MKREGILRVCLELCQAPRNSIRKLSIFFQIIFFQSHPQNSWSIGVPTSCGETLQPLLKGKGGPLGVLLGGGEPGKDRLRGSRTSDGRKSSVKRLPEISKKGFLGGAIHESLCCRSVGVPGEEPGCERGRMCVRTGPACSACSPLSSGLSCSHRHSVGSPNPPVPLPHRLQSHVQRTCAALMRAQVVGFHLTGEETSSGHS